MQLKSHFFGKYKPFPDIFSYENDNKDKFISAVGVIRETVYMGVSRTTRICFVITGANHHFKMIFVLFTVWMHMQYQRGEQSYFV